MATVTLTGDSFQQTIEDNDIVLVHWWAEWSGPCNMYAPTFASPPKTTEAQVFAKVDTEAEQDLAMAARIQSIPMLMIFREGILLFAQPGALPAPALEDLIDQVKALDMEDVRAQLADQDGGQDVAEG